MANINEFDKSAVELFFAEWLVDVDGRITETIEAPSFLQCQTHIRELFDEEFTNWFPNSIRVRTFYDIQLNTSLGSSWVRLTVRETKNPGVFRWIAVSIADQKKQEHRLELLEKILQTLSVGVTVVDPSLSYHAINPWFLDNAAEGKKIGLGEHVFTTVQPELHEPTRMHFEYFFETMQPTHTEWSSLDSSKKVREFSVDMLPMTLTNGEKYQVTVMTDVTEKRRAQHQVALFSRVLESMPLILFRLNSDGLCTELKGAGLREIPWDTSQLLSQNALTLAQGTPIEDTLRKALKGEETQSEHTIPGPLHYRTWLFPVPDVLGGQGSVLGLALDVSRDREIALHLQEQLTTIQQQQHRIELFHRALESAPVVLWATNTDGKIILSEGNGLQKLGLQPGEAVGMNVRDLYAGNADVLASIDSAFTGQQLSFVVEPHPGVFFENIFVPLYSSDSHQLQGLIGFAIDASERARRDRELREKVDLIERQNATIRALATPIIRVWDQVICLPVIGTVDSHRTAEMMEALLQAVMVEKARFTIIDLTGVEIVDTSTADHLLRLFKAAKVLGVEGVLCGIQPAVAQTIVTLGMELGDVRTMRTLQDALKWCIAERNRTAAQQELSLTRLRLALGGDSGSKT